LAENCGNSCRQEPGYKLPATAGHKGTTEKVIPFKEDVVSLPTPLDNEEFKAAWSDWISYRKEARLRPWIARTVKAQHDRLAEWGSPRAVAAIRASITQGWQGIYEPQATSQKTRPPVSVFAGRF